MRISEQVADPVLAHLLDRMGRSNIGRVTVPGMTIPTQVSDSTYLSRALADCRRPGTDVSKASTAKALTLVTPTSMALTISSRRLLRSSRSRHTWIV